MDGLQIRGGQSLLDTGKSISESRNDNANVAKPLAPGQNDPSKMSFADTLKEAVGSVNTLQKNADTQAQNLATGKTTDIPQVMMAAEKADIALRLMVNVRNKIISAYEEVMKMQV
ncbi:MAG: flagellar hook-basal body complex protein FliE [Proteobacteria bacterium]|nr:MAG: flagellar hook-basal body complex protein FliE [Pseudomonadota bacterium]